MKWYSFLYYGREVYRTCARSVLDAKKQMEKALRERGWVSDAILKIEQKEDKEYAY